MIPRPPARAWWIATGFFFVWLAVMLAGSDIPPPVGFIWVAVGLVLIFLSVALAAPLLWQVATRRGARAVLWRTTALGAAAGIILAAIFASRGSGEPSIPPLDVADYAIWFSVLTVVGAVNGVIVGAVLWWLRPGKHETEIATQREET